MTVVGFHASHEQIHPSALLDAVALAEEVGFTAAMCSDHFAPWSAAQGHSALAWAWLGAALERTSLPIGVVTAPGQRYHPAIVAQAAATLEAMHPGRHWVALGSGEHVNEHITGDPWPRKEVRDARLHECARIIQDLLAGEEVSHDGLVTVDRARLWTRPDPPPAVLAAAVSPAKAAAAAAWADGLITVNQPPEVLRDVLGAYRGAGGRGPTALQVHLSWAPDEDEALAIALDQWRANAPGPPLTWEAATVEELDQVGALVGEEEIREAVLVSGDLKQHAAWLQERADLGFDQLYLHHVGQDQRPFLDGFGEHVLPELEVTAP